MGTVFGLVLAIPVLIVLSVFFIGSTTGLYQVDILIPLPNGLSFVRI